MFESLIHTYDTASPLLKLGMALCGLTLLIFATGTLVFLMAANNGELGDQKINGIGGYIAWIFWAGLIAVVLIGSLFWLLGEL